VLVDLAGREFIHSRSPATILASTVGGALVIVAR
jgi:hypothetical protein